MEDQQVKAEPEKNQSAAASPSASGSDKAATEEPQSLVMRGQTSTTSLDDDNNNEELTPPPDTPLEDNMSNNSSQPANALEDEIVVGTNVINGAKPSPVRLPSETADQSMDDVDDEQPISHYPKRKRASVFNDLNEDKIDRMTIDEPVEVLQRKPAKVLHGTGAVKGVILGFWRDSPVPDEVDKHGVIGFIDVRDRLRTRIQTTNRTGKIVANEFPLPPGPGGSWVTFDKVAFDPHLVNLDHFQVKEYVKIRAEMFRKDETEEETQELNKKAVQQSIKRLTDHPPPETAQAPSIAYGPVIPEHAQIAPRPEAKKRRIGSAAGTPAHLSPNIGSDKIDNIPGTRPTKVLLGVWKRSTEAPENRHAVYGILGANDMFRVKVTRETRDGRTVIGNFPTGAGALWLHWEDVDFDIHLQALTRPEVKEYVRVRQWQLDQGEDLDDRIANETKAVIEAQMRVANVQARKDEVPHAAPLLPREHLSNGNGMEESYDMAHKNSYGHELRHSRRGDNVQMPRARHSLPDVRQTPDAMERANHLARREIARMESAQSRADLRAANRDIAPNKALFQDNVQRLNKVWAAQEANRLKAGAEDAKIYMGVKFERKATGPFQGKLVSNGNIISIDGEDYVEYRVLTKPSFF